MESTERITLKRNTSLLTKDIAEGLVALRTKQGWTRKDLASLLFDVSVQHIYGWEHQVRLPRGVHLLRISRLLGLELTNYPVDAVRATGVVQAVRFARKDLRKPLPVIDIATLIATARMLSGLPMDEFAKTWGVTTNSMRNWEDGILPKGANATKVAAHLGLPVTAMRLA